MDSGQVGLVGLGAKAEAEPIYLDARSLSGHMWTFGRRAENPKSTKWSHWALALALRPTLNVESAAKAETVKREENEET